ncbi:MAG: T9SS type A sorting domain-containing protein, partial [Flavobacteriales bacterium]|nr:T9SS type A sorting domain-containing protein [Flavobacteriales bacterium]
LGNCTVVSDCYFVGSTSIPDHDAERISVWPNPSTGVVQVAGIGAQDRLLVKDALGREVPTQRTGARLVLTDATPGLHFLQVLRPDGRSVSHRFLVR